MTKTNRAEVYGDVLFQTIRVVDGNPQLAMFHYEQLMKGAEMLKYMVPAGFTFDYFMAQIKEAVKGYDSNTLRVRYMLKRENGGFYLPLSNACIEELQVTETSSMQHQPINRLGVYSENTKSQGNLSAFKTGNALLYTLAAIYAQHHQLDDVCVLNSRGEIIEALSSNIFWFKNEHLYTTPQHSGCIHGVMRRFLVGEFSVVESVCDVTTLLDADEVFLTNSIQGIRSVVHFENKEYTSTQTQQIRKRCIELLNS